MSHTSPSPVLVVGAGPVGLSMAAELARHGVPCRLVEQAAAPSDKSRAIGVHARTLETFAAMGLADAVVAAGWPVHASNFWADGRRLAHVGFEGVESPFPFVLMLAQDRTEALLAAHAAGLGVAIEREVALTAVRPVPGGAEATLRHADGREEQVWAPAVIGCDGAHSAVRHALGVAFEGAPYEEDWFLADVPIETTWAPDEIHAFFHPDGVLVVMPLGPDRARLITQRPATGRAPAAPLDAAAFQALLDAQAPPGLKLGEANWLSAFRIHHRLAARFGEERVFLAGDAAHIHSPVGGQGMNTGIQDAVNLAWKLALVLGGKAHEGLLASYEAERRPIAAGVLRETDVATRAATLRDPLSKAVRNEVLRFATQFEGVQRRAASQAAEVTVAYPGSPIVAGHGAGWFGLDPGPAPGDHAPDERVQARLRGPAHGVLLFAGPGGAEAGRRQAETLAEPVRARLGAADVLVVAGEASEGVLADPDGTLHRRYGASGPTLFLVRPDGYVAFKDRNPDVPRLVAYLDKVYGGG